MSSHPSPHAPTVITFLGDLKFDAQIRGHHIVLDQPIGVGDDTGPTPLELLAASLGSCVALYIKQFCQARRIPYEGLRVEVREDRVKHPSRIADFIVDVQLPEEVTGRYATLIEEVARACPVHNTLLHGAEVHVKIETGVTAGV